MRDLPTEIYPNIFQYLKRKDPQTCHFVCKHWYTIAIPLHWEVLALNHCSIAFVKSHLNDICPNQYFKYRRLIKKIAFQDATLKNLLFVSRHPISESAHATYTIRQ